MSEKADIVEWRELLKNEEEVYNIDTICDFIANGGSMVKYCRENHIRFSDLNSWISRSKDRKTAIADAKRIWQELVRQSLTEMILNLARFDVAEMVDSHNTAMPIHKWPAHIRASVEQVEINESGAIKVKFTPRSKAFEMAAKMSGILEQKHVHEVGESLAELIERATEGDDGPDNAD